MRLAIGELVVYGAHGAGSITDRVIRTVGDEEHVVVVLSLANGLSVELPLARAEDALRPIADDAEIDRLGIVLRSHPALDPAPWLKRQPAARAKLTTAIGLAEIVTDGARRSSLSPTERDLVRNAKSLLAGEIALSRGEDTSAAAAWIDEHLGAAQPQE